MRLLQAWALLAVLIGASGAALAQESPGILDADRHPLAPDHRLKTITLGGTIRTEPQRPLFVVATKIVIIADGVGRESKWPNVVLAAGDCSSIDKTKRREFVVSVGSPTATTKAEAAPTVVSLEEGARVEIRLLDNGDDLISLDVTFEELTVRESEKTVNVRETTLAAPEQTGRRVRSFRAAKLGTEIRIPLDGASAADSKQVLLLKVTRK
jgi:hypothetical protein